MFERLRALKNCSLTQCNKEDLRDLESIVIDPVKPKAERMLDFLYQIKNPYLFKVGDIAVKVVYGKDNITLQQKMEGLVQSNFEINR